jgi:hypothetical protein
MYFLSYFNYSEGWEDVKKISSISINKFMEKIELQKLIDENNSIYDIAKIYGKSYTATKYWINKHGLKTKFKSFSDKSSDKSGVANSYGKKDPNIFDLGHLDHAAWTTEQRQAYSYILGFYLGDGCLYNTKGRSYTMMIANQADFYEMNLEIERSISILFPNKKVTFYKKPTSNCYDIKVTAINLHELFPHGRGAKHSRKISLMDWQKGIVREFPQKCIKGLIQSDGTRYVADIKRYPHRVVYQFSNCSIDIHHILHELTSIENIDFTFRQMKFKKSSTHADSFITSFYKRSAVAILDSFIGPKK